MKCYTLTIILQEDLHTGSGTGAGEYDALLSRDRNGRPFIAYSHWQGVWRYNLQRYLTASKQSLKTSDALFGKENGQRGLLTGTALYSDTPVKTLAWTSSSRMKYSRTTQENTLRVKEFIAAGSRFSATLWLADDSLEKSLKTACRITDVLGARRQRGDGRISAELTAKTLGRNRNKKATNTIKLLLRANDPICLPTTGHPGNIIESECYLRGQVLRGAIIGKLLRNNKKHLAKQLITADFKVNNAYPLPIAHIDSSSGWREWEVQPMPLNYNQPKPHGGGDSGLPWWAQEIPTAEMQNRFSDEPVTEKLKRPADHAFIFKPAADQRWEHYTTALALRMRNAQASEQHPDGALFSQQEIAENTLFLTEIQCPGSNIAERLIRELKLLFSGDDCLTVGRGGAPLTIEKWLFISENQTKMPDPPPHKLTLTLSSDLIARSPTLSFYQTLSPKVLFELSDLPPPKTSGWQQQSFTDNVEIYGFNAMTGLPRLPALAIRRGSAISIEGNNLSELKQVLQQRNALGERTEEGFGQFYIDYSPILQSSAVQDKKALLNEKEQLFAQAEKAYAQIKAIPDDHWPKLTQWQALRSNEDDLVTTIEKYKERLEEKKDHSRIAWLKTMPSKQQSWLDWLVRQLKTIKPEQQRAYYKALLVYIRLHLRAQEVKDDN